MEEFIFIVGGFFLAFALIAINDKIRERRAIRREAARIDIEWEELNKRRS